MFNYCYEEHIINSELVANCNRYHSGLLDSSPDIYEIIDNYRTETNLTEDNVDYEDELTVWENTIRNCNGKPNPNIMDFRVVFWILNKGFFESSGLTLPGTLSNRHITPRELAQIAKNAYKLNRALKSFPTVPRHCTISVYRGESPGGIRFQQILTLGVGQTVQINSFMSTSLNPEVATRFSDSGIFKINLTSGKYLSFVSREITRECELEVLLPFGITLHIDTIEKEVSLYGLTMTFVEMTLLDYKAPTMPEKKVCKLLKELPESWIVECV